MKILLQQSLLLVDESDDGGDLTPLSLILSVTTVAVIANCERFVQVGDGLPAQSRRARIDILSWPPSQNPNPEV